MTINQLFGLEGKIAVVTGGTGVLGGAMAEGLARAGARVAILGRRREAAQALAEQIEQRGGQALALAADVLDINSLHAAQQHLHQAWGKADILVNVAGGNMPGATITPEKTVFDLDLADLDRVMALNFNGTVMPTQVFAQDMTERKSGIIINISSMAAQRALTRVLGYSAAKAAIDNYTRWMAVEMAQKFGEGIRVNAIAPGFFIGEQNRRLLTNEDGSLTPRGQTIIRQTPMGRFGKSDELNGTLIWLCSEAARFVTGIVVPVDGGFGAFSGV